MKYLTILFLILLSTTVLAADNLEKFSYTFDMNDSVINTKHISEECDKEFREFFGQDVTVMMKEYCSGINGRLIFILLISMILWLIEPKLTKKLQEHNLNYLTIFIKWIGLGLLAIVLISMWFVR